MPSSETLRVMSLHALYYCERLFYLEEVEEIRVADERVFAGRTLHEALGEEGEFVDTTLESPSLGLRGRVDALRLRGGRLLAYEHKRGRSRKEGDVPAPWPSDRIQAGAYAMLLEEATGAPVTEARIRYHGDKTLVHVPIDEDLRREVREAITRARVLADRPERPQVHVDDRKCPRCSLAPICLPEETRKAANEAHVAARLFPRDDDRRTLHVFGHGSRIGRRGDELLFTPLDGPETREPVREIRSVSVHGNISVSSQALQLCADHGIAVHWFGAGSWYVGTFLRDDAAVQRRIRQYEALREPATRVRLARKLVLARASGQLRFLLRSTRGRERGELSPCLDEIRSALRAINRAEDSSTLLGIEGQAAAAYWRGLPQLFAADIDPEFVPSGRSRRPPRDGFNAALSFGYALLLREIVQSIRTVGLDGAFGFYHQPRSSAPPLALDLMELFRVPCVDMALVAAVNRGQFKHQEDIQKAGDQVWLSEKGRRKVIEIYERRMSDCWQHPVLDYSLSYRRHLELEVRLLEKEWSGEPGLFARMRIR